MNKIISLIIIIVILIILFYLIYNYCFKLSGSYITSINNEIVSKITDWYINNSKHEYSKNKFKNYIIHYLTPLEMIIKHINEFNEYQIKCIKCAYIEFLIVFNDKYKNKCKIINVEYLGNGNYNLALLLTFDNNEQKVLKICYDNIKYSIINNKIIMNLIKNSEENEINIIDDDESDDFDDSDDSDLDDSDLDDEFENEKEYLPNIELSIYDYKLNTFKNIKNYIPTLWYIMKYYNIKSIEDIKNEELINNYGKSLKQIFKLLYDNNLAYNGIKFGNVGYDDELEHFIFIDFDVFTFDDLPEPLYRFLSNPKIIKNIINEIIKYEIGDKIKNILINIKNTEIWDKYLFNVYEKSNVVKAKYYYKIENYINYCLENNIDEKYEEELKIIYDKLENICELIGEYNYIINKNIGKLSMTLSFMFDILNVEKSDNNEIYSNNIMNENINFIDFDSLLNNKYAKEIYEIFKNDIFKNEEEEDEFEL